MTRRMVQVSKVWTAVDKQAVKQHTSIIHGKWSHEETIATASFATTYLIIRDKAEAQYVCDYIIHGGDRDHFLEKFSQAKSKGAHLVVLLSGHTAGAQARVVWDAEGLINVAPEGLAGLMSRDSGSAASKLQDLHPHSDVGGCPCHHSCSASML